MIGMCRQWNEVSLFLSFDKNRHFSIVTSRFYELIAPMSVLWSEIRGGEWAPSKTAMLLDFSGDADAARLRAILSSRGCCLVQVPSDLKCVLVTQNCCHSEVTPKLVRQLVREARGIRPAWPTGQEDAQFLLVYCTTDLMERHDFAELDGLPLVPLANGSLGRFSINPSAASAAEEEDPKAQVQGKAMTTATSSNKFFLVEDTERALFINGQHVLGKWYTYGMS